MKFLLDTHLLLWAAAEPHKLSADAYAIMNNPEHELFFSPVSIWEVAIKNNLARQDFHVNPHILRRGLLDNGYEELPINSSHACLIFELPLIHKDPFDRMLIAQSLDEGITLLTADPIIAQYQGAIRQV